MPARIQGFACLAMGGQLFEIYTIVDLTSKVNCADLHLLGSLFLEVTMTVCSLSYEGICGSGGKDVYVKNSSSSTKYQVTIDVKENGADFSQRINTLNPGEKQPINVCTQVGTKYYTCFIVGELKQ
jgi:hypothetical protein